MNWEIGIDIHKLLCIAQITNENLLYGTGNSTQCSLVTEGIYVHTKLNHFAVQQKLAHHCKGTKLQL